MRILLVSTLKRRVGQDISASRSAIIYQLGKTLTQRGHTVGLLGTKDSIIPGVATHSVIDKSFVDMPPFENPFYGEVSYLVVLEKRLEKIANDYDIIHNHTYPEMINLFASERTTIPLVTTLHTQVTSEYDHALSFFPRANLVALSEAQKRLFKKARIGWVVHNGVDTEIYRLKEKKEDYLLWLGRLGRAKDEKGNFVDTKGVRWAISLAREIGERLIISGNVEDIKFYEKDVKPYLNDRITWYGPVSKEQVLARQEVVKLMQGARAFLMTINWEEPFGLVMAEAMSCGTPVIAFDRGSVRELIIDGQTGFIVAPSLGVDGLKSALSRINEISPRACREHVEKNFSLDQMVNKYIHLYKQLIQ